MKLNLYFRPEGIPNCLYPPSNLLMKPTAVPQKKWSNISCNICTLTDPHLYSQMFHRSDDRKPENHPVESPTLTSPPPWRHCPALRRVWPLGETPFVPRPDPRGSGRWAPRPCRPSGHSASGRPGVLTPNSENGMVC